MFMGRFAKDRKLDYKTQLWIDGQVDYMDRNINRLTANDKIELYDFLINSSGECLEEFLLGIKNKPRLYKHLQPLLLEVALNRKPPEEVQEEENEPVPMPVPNGWQVFEIKSPQMDTRPWIVKLFHSTVKFIRSKIVKM